METRGLLAAFASGCSAVVLVACLVADVRAQIGGQGAIDVCLAEDGVLRLVPSPSNCATGQKGLRFVADSHNAQPDTMDESFRTRLTSLERRVSNLEDAASRGELGNKVVEPFTVTSETGKTVFSVTKTSADSGAEVSVYNNNGKVVTSVGTSNQEEVAFEVKSGTSDLRIVFGIKKSWSGLLMFEHGVSRVSLGRTTEKSDRYGLEFVGPDNAMTAAIVQSAGGGGLAFVADHGARKAGMFLTDDKSSGTVGILSGKNDIAVMTEADSGGGLLRISSANSQPMVEAVAEKPGTVSSPRVLARSSQARAFWDCPEAISPANPSREVAL